MLAEDPGHTKGQERSLQNQVGPKKEERVPHLRKPPHQRRDQKAEQRSVRGYQKRTRTGLWWAGQSETYTDSSCHSPGAPAWDMGSRCRRGLGARTWGLGSKPRERSAIGCFEETAWGVGSEETHKYVCGGSLLCVRRGGATASSLSTAAVLQQLGREPTGAGSPCLGTREGSLLAGSLTPVVRRWEGSRVGLALPHLWPGAGRNLCQDTLTLTAAGYPENPPLGTR